jgi:hypothetical protein
MVLVNQFTFWEKVSIGVVGEAAMKKGRGAAHVESGIDIDCHSLCALSRPYDWR